MDRLCLAVAYWSALPLFSESFGEPFDFGVDGGVLNSSFSIC